MPSRPAPVGFPAPEIPNHHRHTHRVLIPVLASSVALAVVGVVLAVVFFIYRKLCHNRTAPFEHNNGGHGQTGVAPASCNGQHKRFSYSMLRRATESFSASNLLGHGGFGSVYKATLPSGETLAVKVMDSEGSIQGEREFQNELSLALSLSSPHILSLLGFSTGNRGRKMLLVYELMPNRSLQEALFDRKCSELMDWKRRFRIALEIALGLEYLHHACDPAVIHGDVKPSNVLLAADFGAKIGDFGLARLRTEDSDPNHRAIVVEEEGEDEDFSSPAAAAEKSRRRSNKELLDNGSIVEEETESVSVITGGFDEGMANSAVDRSPNPEASPEELLGGGAKRKGGSNSARDWWWKQDNCGESESGRVKDYVMEWIGSEIGKERPKTTAEWSESEVEKNQSKKKRPKRLEWWASMEDRKRNKKKKPREWWKEEFCEELTRRSKNKHRNHSREWWWNRDGDGEDVERKKKRRKSIDWWLDGISGEIARSGRRNSRDWTSDIPKSGNISSTPSMRGTVCYVAPEYGGGGTLSEKCDVYSFGVLILVLVSGRRPLQVTASPISEFERANLTSWARQLARNGKLLELVDPALHSVDKDEALLCLTIALLCLQRTPGKRPSMREIVGMLSGEAEPPSLPFEFSPSPPSNFPFKSRKKAR